MESFSLKGKSVRVVDKYGCVPILSSKKLPYKVIELYSGSLCIFKGSCLIAIAINSGVYLYDEKNIEIINAVSIPRNYSSDFFLYSEERKVKRIDNFCRGKFLNDKKVLDIGSGTCVFLYEMKKLGFKTYCIDPDHSAINHAEKVVKVNGAYHGDLLNININNRFELITFNKVFRIIYRSVNMRFSSKIKNTIRFKSI